MWYLLWCRECDPGLTAEFPFRSAEDRGKWAGEHTRGTGHDKWFVLDLPEEIHDDHGR
jgi:hypothetical protein